jgi:hypothetical protein
MKPGIRSTLLTILALTYANANADQFTISLDTSSLSGTQTLGFELTDGDAPPAPDNSAVLSNFAFGGGSAAAGTEDCTLGGTFGGTGCSGSLDTSVTLTDTLDAFFTQQFTVGSLLSFTLTTTNNFVGTTPDQFAMFVCNAGVDMCYSDDTNTFAMLTLDLTGGTLSPSSFALNGASDQSLPAPVVTLVSAVSEPPAILLLALGLFGMAVGRKRVTAI